MSRKKVFSTYGYRSDADILDTAHISEDPNRMQISLLTPEVNAVLVEGRLHGHRPVCVYWPCGEFALMFLEADGTLPPEKIIAAYRRCKRSNQCFPEGESSWV